MAEQKTTFPILPARWWWGLRGRFKQSVPPTVTSSYLAAVLHIGQESAARIAMPGFKKIGLIDQNGKPQELAIRWRDDQRYADVCKEMLRDLYPQELLEAIPAPASDRGTAERWFANITGAGESAVTKMVSFYQLLCEADPNKQGEVAKHPDSEGSSKGKLPRNSNSTNARDRKPKPQSKSVYENREISTPLDGIPPALALLVRSLPPEGTPLPSWRRKQWLRMAGEVLAFMYPNEVDDKPEEDGAEE
jgi:hypothetical protein